MEQDVKALVKVIIVFECEGLEWISAGLGVRGPSGCSRLKDIFVALRFEPLAAQ